MTGLTAGAGKKTKILVETTTSTSVGTSQELKTAVSILQNLKGVLDISRTLVTKFTSIAQNNKTVLDLIHNQKTALLIETGVYYNLLLPQIFLENLEVSDTNNIVFVKSLENFANLIDEPYLGIGVSLTDTLAILDIHSMSSIKSLAHNTNITDIISLSTEYNISFSSVSQLVDIASMGPNKGPIDNVALLDITSFVNVFNRTFIDQYIITDDTLKSPEKVVIDSGLINDTINFSGVFNRSFSDSYQITDTTTSDINKIVIDLAYATDDIFGEADVDDQQYYLFNKNILDTGSISDQIILNTVFNSFLNDIPSISDNVTVGFQRAFPDSTAITDNITNTVDKAAFSLTNTSDLTYYFIDKVIEDVTDVYDNLILINSFNRFVGDNSQILDVSSINSTKPFEETTSVSSNISLNPGLRIYNTYFLEDYLVDNIDYAYSDGDPIYITDSTLFNSNRNILETSQITDSLSTIFDSNRNILETSQIIDSTLFSSNRNILETSQITDLQGSIHLSNLPAAYTINSSYISPSIVFNIMYSHQIETLLHPDGPGDGTSTTYQWAFPASDSAGKYWRVVLESSNGSFSLLTPTSNWSTFNSFTLMFIAKLNGSVPNQVNASAVYTIQISSSSSGTPLLAQRTFSLSLTSGSIDPSGAGGGGGGGGDGGGDGGGL